MDNRNLIVEGLRTFKFGATIEVTNGISKENNYRDKAQQSLNAKSYLEHLTDRDVLVATGLAYIKSNTAPDYSKKINVLLNVEKYKQKKLKSVLEKSLDSCGLRKKERGLVEKILKVHTPDWPLQEFISCVNGELKVCAGYLGIPPAEYKESLADIKGVVMELYIQSLFEEELAKKITFRRHKYKHKGIKSDADVIVICPEHRFYGALQRLDQRPDISAKVLTRKR